MNKKNQNDTRKINQYQIINWPDHSEPEKETGYATIEQVLMLMQENICFTPKSPILLHCSGGIGRTGTMIAIYNIIKSFSIVKIWNNLTQYSLKPFMSVFNSVRKLREQRYGMVSSMEQYKYIYDFCLEWFNRNFFSNDEHKDHNHRNSLTTNGR